ncbi:MAG: DUF1592 domain-containing protein [Planctomycetaceae bacterium]|nr:DUF1592 domain-containing protein [Planctomycetaceae bacterium]
MQLPPPINLICFAALLVSLTAMDASAQNVDATPDYTAEVLPILMARCGQCHGPEEQEANLRFDQLSTDFLANRDTTQKWMEALNAINGSKMPPADEPQLSADERNIVTDWISTNLQQAISTHASTGGRVVLRRLNRAEYQQTMVDLLGLEMNYVRDFPPDGRSADGFFNNGRSLRMSATQLTFYLEAARRGLGRVIVNDPPPQVFRHHFKQSNIGGWRGPTEPSNRLERAQKFLVKIVDNYPEEGDFIIRVRAQANLKPNKGFPLLEVSVGYRPDTEVHFRIAGVREIISNDVRQYEFRGRLENFPLPVRGQGKYPGLVIRLRNVYDDGTPIPNKIEKINENGKERNGFRPEPHLPNLLIESLDFEGPAFSEWPPTNHQRILFASEQRHANEQAYLEEVFRRFLLRAYRRPPTNSEIELATSFYKTIRPDYPSLEAAVRETLAMILVQPDFLYLVEPAGDEKRAVSDWELASRLSYFLWSTMPDEQLLASASSGLLRESKLLKAEVERLLADERSQRFITEFVSQWLELERIETIAVDSKSHPGFRDSTKPVMAQETTELFHQLLRTDDSALKLIKADFTMLNERLARHYGMGGVYGTTFRPVKLLTPQQPGGILGHAGLLLANSNGKDSHPIRRAVWIRDRLLGDPPLPPPPDVPDLDEANPNFAKLSVRERLEIHREKASCASCHRNIDPWGIALENFDAVGHWRDTIPTQDGKPSVKPILAVGMLPDGTQLEGLEGLQRHLIEHRTQQFSNALTRRLMSFALGRSLEFTDEEEANALAADFAEKGFRLRHLVQQIVASQAFQTK